MKKFGELIANVEIENEYRKTLLLNMFRKIVVKMNRDEKYENKVRTIFRESFDYSGTIKALVEREFDIELEKKDADEMATWFRANLRKGKSRKAITFEVKRQLYEKQKGKCMACGEPLGDNWSKIHVDHIIPWTLVGDELKDNFQDLCETCNECKSAQTDYIFRNMINLL